MGVVIIIWGLGFHLWLWSLKLFQKSWSLWLNPLPHKETEGDHRKDEDNEIDEQQEKVSPWKDLASLHIQ